MRSGTKRCPRRNTSALPSTATRYTTGEFLAISATASLRTSSTRRSSANERPASFWTGNTVASASMPETNPSTARQVASNSPSISFVLLFPLRRSLGTKKRGASFTVPAEAGAPSATKRWKNKTKKSGGSVCGWPLGEWSCQS